MNVRNGKPVLVLLASLILTIACVSGCAGFAEPLPSIAVAPDSLTVSAKVGSSSALPVTLINTGKTSVNVSQAVLTGTGFSMTGLTMPLTLAGGQSSSFSVKFAATTTGSTTGSLTLMTDSLHRPVRVPLHGNGSSILPDVSSITVSPAFAASAPNARLQFTAAIQGTTSNDSVTWTASIGAISASGVFTAPAAGGSGRITATSVADPSKSATALVTVAASSNVPSTSGITSVTVSPSPASSAVGGALRFTATVLGSASNKTVTWRALLGTISAAGAYTAPAKAGTDVVTATSALDTSESGSATITVTAASAPTAPPVPPPAASGPAVTSVTISPGATSSTTGGTLQFSATIQGTTTDKSVAWKAAQGQISSAGLYTAPSSAGTDTVTVTSDADVTKSSSAQVTVTAPTSGALPAFPTAQGGGAASAGGRGGVVIEVTTTADSGTGSLRACATAVGPRTCIFRVAGLFPTDSEIEVDNPFLTVACQSAPGQVLLGGPTSPGILRISTHDTIVRYCTFSPDNPNIASGPDTGTVGYSIINTQAYNNITDHITSRWAGNKEWIAYAGFAGEYNSNSTMQYSLIYEPHEGHPVGPSTSENDTVAITQSSPGFDSHHNMLVNIDHRIPEYNNPTMRWINNYTYNYSTYAVLALGATQSDIIGNVWDYNNLQPGFGFPIYSTDGTWPGSLPGTPSFYIAGNIGNCSPNCTTVNSDQYGQLAHQAAGENVVTDLGAFPSSWQRSAPLPSASAFPITVTPAPGLLALLAPTVGNSQHLDCNGNWVSHRDPEDTRIVGEVTSHGTGGFWPNGVTFIGQSSFPTPSNNWTDHPQTGFTSCTESMHDGIPDQWKTLKGLSTTDPNLYSRTAPNGYTWLENYLNGQ
jgi:hypothetical protein